MGTVACTALVSLEGLSSGTSKPDADGAGQDAGEAGSGDADSGDADGDAAPEVLRPYVEEVLADEPAAYWRLGEASASGPAKDERGSSPGEYTGNGSLGAAGAIRGDPNTAAQFAGGTIRCGDVFGFEGRAAFSVEMWVMPTTIDSTFRHFYTKLTDTTPRSGHLMWVHATEGFTFERNVDLVFSGGGVQDATIHGAGLPLDTWSYLVATYDGANMRLYLDGVQKDVVPSTASMKPTGTQFILGAGFLGRMDEVAVYTRALPADRIRTHYKAAGY
jgi:hypothetical protein